MHALVCLGQTCCIYALEARDVHVLFKHFPECQSVMAAVARERIETCTRPHEVRVQRGLNALLRTAKVAPRRRAVRLAPPCMNCTTRPGVFQIAIDDEEVEFNKRRLQKLDEKRIQVRTLVPLSRSLQTLSSFLFLCLCVCAACLRCDHAENCVCLDTGPSRSVQSNLVIQLPFQRGFIRAN